MIFFKTKFDVHKCKFSGQKPLFDVLSTDVQHYFGTISDSCKEGFKNS